MMKIFILILAFSGDGKAISAQEFNSLETCQKAGQEFVNTVGSWANSVKYICTEK